MRPHFLARIAKPFSVKGPGLLVRHAAGQLRSFAALQDVPALRTGDWDINSVKDLLSQVAREGALEVGLLDRLRGKAPASDADSDGGVEESGEGSVACGLPEMVSAAELCSAKRLRDYVLMAALADRLAPQVSQASDDSLRRVSLAYSTLGVLNAPLFQAIAGTLLERWAADAATTSVQDLVLYARAFSSQRMRHEELFDRMADHLRKHGVAACAPEQAMSLLHSHAVLRLSSEMGALWDELEAQVVSKGLGAMSANAIAELCYLLVLTRRADDRQKDLCKMLEALADKVLALPGSFWTEGEGPILQNRVLLLRSAMRYLYKDTYKTLPEAVVKAFRLTHRMESTRNTIRPTVSFSRKLSGVLSKMKIGHTVNFESGPFTFDVVERDRKIVYECNHFDRYYVGSTDKIATMSLQERVVKGMGYRVIQVPHWHWNKIKHRKQRGEYLRMSRYYAIKDRRELTPREDVPTDVASNPFDYMGEHFFRKEMPSSSWSWFQPRYDARRRLPGQAPTTTA